MRRVWVDDFLRSALRRERNARLMRADVMAVMREWCAWVGCAEFTAHEVNKALRAREVGERKSNGQWVWIGAARRESWYPIPGVTPGTPAEPDAFDAAMSACGAADER